MLWWCLPLVPMLGLRVHGLAFHYWMDQHWMNRYLHIPPAGQIWHRGLVLKKALGSLRFTLRCTLLIRSLRCQNRRVADHGGLVDADIVGRATEMDLLRSFLASAAAGRSGTIVISGDAGIGKTALIQHACASHGTLFQLFAGTCLPLTTAPFEFQGLRSAFRSDPTFDAGPGPQPPRANDVPFGIPAAIDDWLDRLCLRTPVILFIDDLQWADQSTLDVLMYLFAGPAQRALAIIVTVRSGEVAEDHPLQRWLADIRRMPRIDWLPLEPLDRLDTEAHVAQLLGAPPHQTLLQEVFEHTGGNPYLNKLIVAGLDPGTRHLQAQLPSDLRGAVLRSWRTLSLSARRLTQLLAVGGGPLSSTDLQSVAQLDGGPGSVLTLLHEAADAGIVEGSADGNTWWFHHPLFSEVLQQSLDGGERTRWHALFATFAQTRLAGIIDPDFESLAQLADHHHASGHVEQAYRWSLRAAAAGRHESSGPATLRLLRRAVELRSLLPEAPESVRDLLSLLRTAAEESGAQEVELDVVESLLLHIDKGAEPLETAALLVRRVLLGFSTGREFMSPGLVREALQLASTDQTSWQYAYALAEMAHSGLWKDAPEAPAQAAQAVAIAREAGNPMALSYACTARSMAALFAGQKAQAHAFAVEGVLAATQARDFWALLHATVWQANATAPWTSQAFADLMRTGRENMQKLGSPHSYLAKMAGDEAASYLSIGLWRESQQALRVAMSSDPGALGDVASRLTAAQMASKQGRQVEAEAHLGRADEIFSPDSSFTNFSFDAVRAQVLLTGGHLEAAYSAAMAGLRLAGQPPTMCEWLVPLAARALADLIQKASDDGGPVTGYLEQLEDLLRDFPSVLHEIDDDDEYLKQVAAFNALYHAEVGRAQGTIGNAQEWLFSAEAAQAVSLRWEECYSWWRAAESLLLRGHAQRPLATTALRQGLVLAQELQAGPIVARLNQLAADARITGTLAGVATLLERSELSEKNPAEQPRLPGLTVREREILEFVIAGHTYAEIARELVISEKTVSSHISNLLRKTGSANRIDLARRASRPAQP